MVSQPRTGPRHFERQLAGRILRSALVRYHLGSRGFVFPTCPVLEKIGNGVRADALVQYWFKQDSYINHDLLNQLITLRETGLELHLATVQEHERAGYLWHTLGFERHFAAIHYAAALGVAKPAQGFFEAIELRTGFQPLDLFFIDDSPCNVEAAIARGWSAAVWDGQTRLIDLLSEHGT
ncbi:MAG: HAD family hydrolase [Bosea sp. (in: a-proteobacteria)]|uniref:HAD family hydrolase n=1 Tax=Bosea sp. (in: a-proteobacteria) TaxID=1871050 RepID=UPI003F7B8784